MKEIRNILSDISFEKVSLNDLSEELEINEDGKTFYENAKKKALAVSQIYRDDYVVGEDSGLEVKHLDKEPGVYSKRYSGEAATTLKNNHKLLDKLKELPMEKREAKFVSCLVLAKNNKEIARFRGELEGRIHNQMEGEGGFGYDPLFFIPEFKKTVAQLEPDQKNKISHRFKAFIKLKRFLRENI
ncbi:MAG: RdgB/HAM1 family non-canonical purine NTP pyrophosphatase [Candidatus Omnitrophica bacterium]|nr:RdgB/HAM1 family non-canonical purine NTP pyrophosphatase [Candidatus Omnitrophota bacterium]MCF7895515.1 RdgB/HAM1 family non-canonical purine NTP pyrophosphatase [Candidatus Omnitrophota bacterium]MCF7898316.1 RdgB/HAM1 family non-canonical purine NTP pyrophosphatase [Candidatus Omnitrophota bacterium]